MLQPVIANIRLVLRIYPSAPLRRFMTNNLTCLWCEVLDECVVPLKGGAAIVPLAGRASVCCLSSAWTRAETNKARYYYMG